MRKFHLRIKKNNNTFEDIVADVENEQHAYLLNKNYELQHELNGDGEVVYRGTISYKN